MLASIFNLTVRAKCEPNVSKEVSIESNNGTSVYEWKNVYLRTKILDEFMIVSNFEENIVSVNCKLRSFILNKNVNIKQYIVT